MFCTFYKDLNNLKRSDNDYFDYQYKNVSVLTKMRFQLKTGVTDTNLVKQFDITLYPNSMFIMPLSTNRLYTHEIRPSCLPIDMIPTRMGYVARCSKTEAIFRNDHTYIIDVEKYVKLEEASVKNIEELKDLYYKENMGTEIVEYEDIFFSMNNGDYKQPIL